MRVVFTLSAVLNSRFYLRYGWIEKPSLFLDFSEAQVWNNDFVSGVERY